MILGAFLLAATWVALTGDTSGGAVGFGFVLGAILLRAARPLGSGGGFRRVRPLRLVGLALFFLWELVLANLRVALAVVGPRRLLRPAIVAVPLRVDRDAEIALLANLITLTPGTLSLDLSPDRRTLHVHAMSTDGPDALRRDIQQGFERRVLETFR